MSQIYIVKYDYYGYEDRGNSTIFFNLKAFKDENEAGKFLIECITESVRCNEVYDAYLNETKEEFDKITDIVRKSIRAKIFNAKMPENIRMVAIRKKLEDLAHSHKHHLDYPAFARYNDGFEYTIETLELIE